MYKVQILVERFKHTNEPDANEQYFFIHHILDPRSQRAGSYKIGAVIVNV